MILTGKTLGKRQQELNLKVNEVAAKKVQFDDVKDGTEKSDVDKLFKIDLASKYKNIDYIVDVLKNGDSLCISRALKCIWIYDNEFSDIINPDNLHANVFPFMSMKMIKKMLATLSMHIRDENRAASFYNHCVNTKNTQTSYKFLPFTSEPFKCSLLENKAWVLSDMKHENLKHFIGNSLKLAEAYFSKIDRHKEEILYNLRYLYSFCDAQYLELLETNVSLPKNIDAISLNRFGLRLSKDIMKKHKHRVLMIPMLYVNILNKNILIKHSSEDDIKSYAIHLLPNTSDLFWKMHYAATYEHILNSINIQEKYQFIKNIFTSKYKKPFETTQEFYDQNYHIRIMTAEEREEWALCQLVKQNDFHGIGNDYFWFKFVNFDRALSEIKKYVLTTTDSEKRAAMVDMIIESAENETDLERLLNYYYDRHVNENRNKKERFIDKVVKHHKVFEFDDNCWTPLYKLLCSLDVYNHFYCTDRNEHDYRVIALIYYVINNKDFPTGLQQYIDMRDTHILGSYTKLYLDHLNNEQKDAIYQYVLKYYIKKIHEFENQIYNDDVKHKLRNYIKIILDLIKNHEKSSKDCPEVVKKYMLLDSNFFYPEEEPKKITPGLILRIMKADAAKLITELPSIEYNVEHNWDLRLNLLLRKLKIYFAHDIAQDYLNYFMMFLSKPSYKRKVFTAVFSIFQLADEQAKFEFMTKYSPTNPKIDHNQIDRTVLYIQEGICRFACYSRPPVPLSNMSMYIKGDYLHYCLPMFSLYLSNLPLPLCWQFVESLLRSPVSAKKHGLRLAFRCFNLENLRQFLLNAWNKTKNISLRMVIYTSLFNHMLKQDPAIQLELYETLKTFTLSVHQDDHMDVITLLACPNSLPRDIKVDYLDTAWKTINNFTDNTVNIEFKTQLVNNIEINMDVMPKDVPWKIIDEHVTSMLNEKQILLNPERNRFHELDKAKWELVAKYTVKYVQDENNLKIVLDLVRSIMEKCLEMWNDVCFDHKLDTESYTLRKFCHDFIHMVIKKHYDQKTESYTQINPVIEAILLDLRNHLPLQEIYWMEWYIKLIISTNKVLDEGMVRYHERFQIRKNIIKEIACNYASELCDLVKEFIERELYFKYFITHVSVMVKNSLKNMLHALNTQKRHKIVLDDMCVFVGIGLLNFKMVETVSIALHILPIAGSPRSKDEFKELIGNIKKFDNIEIQCLMNKENMSNGFRKLDV